MDVVQRADIRAPVAVSAWIPSAAIVPAVDALALLAAAAIASSTGNPGATSSGTESAGGLGGHLIFAVIAWIVLNAGGWRYPRINPRLGGDVIWILARLAILSIVLLHFTSDKLDPAITVGISASVLLPSRAVAYALLRSVRRRGRITEPTLIVGSGPVAELVASTCREHPEYGLVPIGLLDSAPEPELPLPLLGSPEDLARVVREWDVLRVIVAFGAMRERQLIEVLRAAEDLPVAVYCVPRFFELRVPRERSRTDEIWGIPLTRLTPTGPRVLERHAKRALDLLTASAAVVVLAPVLGCAALAVRLSSPGPILFRQDRIGQGGRPFPLLKFRSMMENNDSDTAWSVLHDDRVTRVGRFLRRTSLDELPQLFNIIRGDMTLVGPRPERPHFVEEFSVVIPRYRDRLRVPAGLTGWAQVHGLRGDTSILERVRFDNAYIENWSLWLDLVIIARTLREALMGGERRARRHEVRRILETTSSSDES
jgi:exopolysaccharide biosynthesis polyprenyl glycosylphosphotransferase